MEEARNGKVLVTEVDQSRTHEFNYYTDGERTLLVGNFSIDGRDWPGRIMYNGSDSFIFKPNPDQCIIYKGQNRLLYGFLPVDVVVSGDYAEFIEIKVMDRDEKTIPIKYMIQTDDKESVVEIVNLEDAIVSDEEMDKLFTLPEDTVCTYEEDFLINVR